MITTLEKLKRGQWACIREIHGGIALRKRLWSMGLHIGNRVDVIQNGVFGGPVLLAIQGSEMAIGQGQARKIVVEVEGQS